MSQQINLILPDLRPRFDWLALPVVAGVASALLALVIGLSVVGKVELDGLRAKDAALTGAVAGLQQQIQNLGQALAARKENPGLIQEVDTARVAVSQREEVVKAVVQGKDGGGPRYSAVMDGFGLQLTDGVWLVGFYLLGDGVEIRGRLTDSSLLPRYIAKLNAEPAFAGRNFSALNMKQVDPSVEKTSVAIEVASKSKIVPRFVEFALTTERIAERGKAE